jgi:DNA polymerase-4
MSRIQHKTRSIIHCDMDAFYASVEQLRRPELMGKPVVVGGDIQSRGVVSTCSYEARKYGIHSAMPVAEAYRRCPYAAFLPPDFKLYQETSNRMHKIFADYTPLIEPLSLDEAFLDVTGSENLFGSAEAIGRKIKQRVKKELGLNISIGVAHNKFLAKLASDLDKPDGFLVVPHDRVQEFLDPLDVRRIWGIGQRMAERLYSLNIRTIKDLRSLDEACLIKLFGISGSKFYQLARGIDDRPVESERKAKSIGRETTFPVDITDREGLEAFLLELSCDVGRSLRKEGIKGRTITLKVKYYDFKTITRSKTLETPTCLDEVIFDEARTMLRETALKPVRLIGVSVSGFTNQPTQQLSLFDEKSTINDKKERLYKEIDYIKDKYGDHSIIRAKLLEPKK